MWKKYLVRYKHKSILLTNLTIICLKFCYYHFGKCIEDENNNKIYSYLILYILQLIQLSDTHIRYMYIQERVTLIFIFLTHVKTKHENFLLFTDYIIIMSERYSVSSNKRKILMFRFWKAYINTYVYQIFAECKI